jgi:hypothetical protein
MNEVSGQSQQIPSVDYDTFRESVYLKYKNEFKVLSEEKREQIVEQSYQVFHHLTV